MSNETELMAGVVEAMVMAYNDPAITYLLDSETVQTAFERYRAAVVGTGEPVAGYLLNGRWIPAATFRGVTVSGDDDVVSLYTHPTPVAGGDLREALQLAHETLHECTAVLTASDCAKVADVMATCRQALTTPARTDDAGEGDVAASFQDRVQPWLMACFGAMIAGDREERNHRFLEEALELVQSCGCTASEAHQLVDYVYGRPVGEPSQEVGGVMVTLAALCLANDLDMHGNAETELARIWTKVEAIRAKQAAKPKHSPLPEHVQRAAHGDGDLSRALNQPLAALSPAPDRGEVK